MDALDVGIGTGRVLERLVHCSPSTRFYGIDLADAMVAHCQARFRADTNVVELRQCDISRDPFPFDHSFGFISAIRVLKYSANWAEIVGHLSSSLAPGGTLAFSIPNRNSVNRVSRSYAVPWYRTTHRELVAACQACGLRVVEVDGFARLPYKAYERSGGGPLLRTVMGTEALLHRLFGRTLFVRELFVAAVKA